MAETIDRALALLPELNLDPAIARMAIDVLELGTPPQAAAARVAAEGGGGARRHPAGLRRHPQGGAGPGGASAKPSAWPMPLRQLTQLWPAFRSA